MQWIYQESLQYQILNILQVMKIKNILNVIFHLWLSLNDKITAISK